MSTTNNSNNNSRNAAKTKSLKDLLSSKDWVVEYQPSHIDIDPKSVFGATTSAAKERDQSSQAYALPNQSGEITPKKKPKTDWMTEYYNSIGAAAATALKPMPGLTSKAVPTSSSIGSPISSIPKSRSGSIDFKMSVDFSTFLTPSMDAGFTALQLPSSDKTLVLTSTDVAATLVPTMVHTEQSMPVETDNKPTDFANPDDSGLVSMIMALSEKEKEQAEEALRAKKAQSQAKPRKKSRRNREPDVKQFVEPLDNDVLLGRGGRSNHHSGNVAYRNEVGNLREWYRSSEKNAKTDLSQLLVDWVHKEQKGRFLKLDASTQQWYIVTNIVARRKASQALREHMTPEERDAKKRGIK